MLKIELLKENIRWDKYSAFHVGYDCAGRQTHTHGWGNPPIIVFDDHQAIITCSEPGPDIRRVYSDLNIELRATNDSGCPTLYTPDGEVVPQAWLKDGGQRYLLIDHCTKRVVQLARWRDSLGKSVPALQGKTGAQNFGAYIPGPGLPPVGATISTSPPDKVAMTKDELAHVRMIERTLTAAAALMGDDLEVNTYKQSYWGKPEPLTCERLLEVKQFTDLKVSEQHQFLKSGRRRRVVSYPYLTVK